MESPAYLEKKKIKNKNNNNSNNKKEITLRKITNKPQSKHLLAPVSLSPTNSSQSGS
jgi:hypothetical protein